MLFWLILGALLAGAIVFTVSYVVTRYNILDTLKNALENAGTEAAQRVLAKKIKAMVKEKKDNRIKIDVLVAQTEKLEVTINCGGVGTDIYKNMQLYN